MAEERKLGAWLGHELGLQTPRVEIRFGSPDAERFFAAVEELLREYPLTQHAQIEIWDEGQESPLRVFRLYPVPGHSLVLSRGARGRSEAAKDDPDRAHGRDRRGVVPDPIGSGSDRLVPFLEDALKVSAGPLVFPGITKDTDLPLVLRRALVSAGIIRCYRHKCGKRGVEDAPDQTPRRCPKHGRVLRPKPQVRPLRWHDLRHSVGFPGKRKTPGTETIPRALRARDGGVEPTTFGSGGQRSIQLS